MDIGFIKQLQRQSVGIQLVLREINYRNMHKEWHLEANCQMLDNLGQGYVPCTIPVQTSRSRHTIVNALNMAELEFKEFPLAGAASGRQSGSRPLRLRQCPRSCIICQKPSFDQPDGCYNPEVISNAKYDWLCNLVRA